jgi:hypothetical protein
VLLPTPGLNPNLTGNPGITPQPRQVAPLQWPVDVYRRVLDRALSPALLTDAELATARAAAAAEAARLGRPSSFSTRRLLRTFTEGGTEHLELSPILSPAPPEGAAAAAAAAGEGGEGAAPAGAPAPGRDAAAGGEAFKELTALDAEFEAILNDLHLILPGSGGSDEERSVDGGAAAPAAAAASGSAPAAAPAPAAGPSAPAG